MSDQQALRGRAARKEASVILSKAWRVVQTQQGIYSGGKVELFPNDETVGCMYGENVVIAGVSNGQVVKVISCGEGEGKEAILTFAVHPKGHEVVTASRNLMMRYWDWRDGRCTRAFKAHETPILALAYDTTGTLVVSGSSDRTVKVWDVPGGFCTHNFRGHSGIVTLVRFHHHPQRELVFSASDDSSVRVWSLAKSACLAVLTTHMSAVTALGITPDGRTLVTAGRDQMLCFWDITKTDASSPDVPAIDSVPVYEAVEGLAVLDTAEARAAGKGYWDTGDEEDMLHRERQVKRPRKGAQDAPVERQGVLALAGAKGTIRVFRFRPKADPLAKGLSVRCIAEQRGKDVYSRGYMGLAASDSGARLLAVTTDHNLMWVHSGSLKRERVLVGYNDEIIDVRCAGKDRLLVATNSPQVRVLNLFDLACSAVLEGEHSETVLALDVDPTGRYVVTASKDRAVCLWDLRQNGQSRKAAAVVCRVRFEGHTGAVSAVALSKQQSAYLPGGTRACIYSAGSDRTLKCWSVPSAEDPPDAQAEVVKQARVSVLAHDKDVNAVAVSPNDALVATASQDRSVKLWAARTLAAMGTLKGHRRGVWSVEFSPVDRVVITGSADRTVKLWSLTDFTCLKTLEGHGASVLRATFLRNGLQVLSTGSDGLMKLWTVRTQECVATLDGHEGKVWALALLPDGKQVVTGGGDSVLNIWEDVTAEEEEEAARRAEEQIEKEQELQSCVYKKDYQRAVRLAIELGRPLGLFKILQEMGVGTVPECEDHRAGRGPLDDMVAEWTPESLKVVLGYMRVWNTNAKHASVAQALLQCMLRRVPHDRLKECFASEPALTGGLLAYTERHLARAERLLQASYLVDYTLSSMNMLFPEDQLESERGTNGTGSHLPALRPNASTENGVRRHRLAVETETDSDEDARIAAATRGKTYVNTQGAISKRKCGGGGEGSDAGIARKKTKKLKRL